MEIKTHFKFCERERCASLLAAVTVVGVVGVCGCSCTDTLADIGVVGVLTGDCPITTDGGDLTHSNTFVLTLLVTVTTPPADTTVGSEPVGMLLPFVLITIPLASRCSFSSKSNCFILSGTARLSDNA